MAGVRRAALVLVMPVLILLLPLHVWALGPSVAVRHLLFGWLLAFLLLEILLHGIRALPLACSYRPDANLKLLAPIYLSIFMLGTYGLAWTEQLMLGRASGTALALAALAVVWLGLRVRFNWSRRGESPRDLDELPSTSTQRLDLSG